MQKDAVKLYRTFDRDTTDRGLVLFGSVKSNPVVCISIAKAFDGAKPFESQDAVATPNDRSCPFMLLYRDEDPHPSCCCGGLKLSKDREGEGAGIYFEPALGDHFAVPDELVAMFVLVGMAMVVVIVFVSFLAVLVAVGVVIMMVFGHDQSPSLLG